MDPLGVVVLSTDTFPFSSGMIISFFSPFKSITMLKSVAFRSKKILFSRLFCWEEPMSATASFNSDTKLPL